MEDRSVALAKNRMPAIRSAAHCHVHWAITAHIVRIAFNVKQLTNKPKCKCKFVFVLINIITTQWRHMEEWKRLRSGRETARRTSPFGADIAHPLECMQSCRVPQNWIQAHADTTLSAQPVALLTSGLQAPDNVELQNVMKCPNPYGPFLPWHILPWTHSLWLLLLLLLQQTWRQSCRASHFKISVYFICILCVYLTMQW
jgi:hypothetical protein